MAQLADRTPKDFRPTASWANLRRRAELLRRLREFFDQRGFLEVETPILSADIVVDRHLDPFSTVLCNDPREPDVGRRLWLQTSPEFGMKRLLVSGGEAIYQVTRAFRNGERGRLHNPEFTLVEWYRVGDSMDQGMQLLSDLSEALLALGPCERLSYAEAFRRHVGIDPHRATTGELMETESSGKNFAPTIDRSDRDGWLNLLLAERVEPHLGQKQPTILYGYPTTQASLADLRTENGVEVAERFELYVKGIELANGYHELRDAAALRQRNATANAKRRADGKPELPEDSRLLEAMEAGLPKCTGVALGFDRLAMIACGASNLADVMAFSVDRA